LSFKTVTDPVHGNISLTKVEAEIMASPVMQRLHNVRQLGLAHMVYPGANYSRFAHSVGASHNAAGLLQAIKRNGEINISPEVEQEYRLVALLHDVGHYPFSHATEHVIENFYAAGLLNNGGGSSPAHNVIPDQNEKGSIPASLKHEPLGEYIIRNDEVLGKILIRHGFDPNAVADRFSKSVPDQLIGIISSDLDCDRLDYLKRTAHNSGAPYGSVDIKFLIDHATVDQDGVFCFLPKAARAADHLLISRFYDYMQVPFNKTVAALEWSLVSCLETLMARSLMDCSGAAMASLVKSGKWNYFDDQKIVSLFRELSQGLQAEGDGVLRDHLAAVLDRRPGKLVAGWDEVRANNDLHQSTKNEFIARTVLADVVKTLSLDPQRVYVWTTTVMFSKADGAIKPEHLSEEEMAEAVQVLDRSSNKAMPLISRSDMLVKHLSSMHMAGLRVYYLPEKGEASSSVLQEIEKRFAAHFGPSRL
jgi:HD superfamily phosphohydrolase